MTMQLSPTALSTAPVNALRLAWHVLRHEPLIALFLSRRFVVCLCAVVFSHSLFASDPPPRWVSAGGALSEWVVALGAQARLVGVDSTSQHPPSLLSLPSIGYQRALSAEGILTLTPQLLLGTEEMGPPPVLEQLRNAGVGIERFSAAADLPSLHGNLQHLGRLLGAPAESDLAWQRYQARLEAQQAWLVQARSKAPTPDVLLILGQAGASPMIAGAGTTADWLLAQAGGHNLATNEGYKALSLEALTAMDPEVIVIADRSLTGDAARQALLRHNPALAATRAAREGRLVVIDPTLLIGGLGPRLPDAMTSLSAAFYPATSALASAAPASP